MRKLDILEIGFMAYSFIIVGLLMFTSCQPKDDILKNAEFPCEMIYKGWDYEVKIQCQDDLYHRKDENYYKKYNKGETIKEPLNK